MTKLALKKGEFLGTPLSSEWRLNSFAYRYQYCRTGTFYRLSPQIIRQENLMFGYDTSLPFLAPVKGWRPISGSPGAGKWRKIPARIIIA